MERYLKETEMLDYNHPTIVHLVEKKGWRNFPVAERIGAIYDFVQNNILFGFNLSADDIKASQVLKDGIGQCNSKGVLMMALLRKCRIPCRLAQRRRQRLQRRRDDLPSRAARRAQGIRLPRV